MRSKKRMHAKFQIFVVLTEATQAEDFIFLSDSRDRISKVLTIKCRIELTLRFIYAIIFIEYSTHPDSK